MEIVPKTNSLERRLETGARRLKRKIVKLRKQKKRDLTSKLLTTGFNNMNLTKDKNLISNSDVTRIKIGSLLDLVTQYSPNNEAVWLESCRMANPVEAKQVIARGLKAMPNSVNLWMKAAELENENVEKMRVLMKGIESIPNSIRLWKEVVGIANEDDAKFLLHKAVECCPLCVEFWLVLACLQESYDDAKMVFDNAVKKLPRNRTVSLARHVLEENKDVTAMIGILIVTGVTCCLRDEEILDTEGARLANEALVQGKGSVAKWEVIKVLMYNAKWKEGYA